MAAPVKEPQLYRWDCTGRKFMMFHIVLVNETVGGATVKKSCGWVNYVR